MGNGKKEDAVVFYINDFYFNFTLLIQKMEVKASITEMHLKSINYTSTTFGQVPLNLVVDLVNWAFTHSIPLFNKLWTDLVKVRVPDTVFGLFKLADLNVLYFDNYLELGLTPTFLPPKMVDREAEHAKWLAEVAADETWYPETLVIEGEDCVSLTINEKPGFLQK